MQQRDRVCTEAVFLGLGEKSQWQRKRKRKDLEADMGAHFSGDFLILPKILSSSEAMAAKIFKLQSSFSRQDLNRILTT